MFMITYYCCVNIFIIHLHILQFVYMCRQLDETLRLVRELLR
jgi:hypothetical protein